MVPAEKLYIVFTEKLRRQIDAFSYLRFVPGQEFTVKRFMRSGDIY